MDLPWGLSQDNTRSGIPFCTPEPTVTLMTDTSLDGWGVCLSVTGDCLQESIEWPLVFFGHSIDSLELEMVLLALHVSGSPVSGPV